jgi:REP element-mobilizing transposase RayT
MRHPQYLRNWFGYASDRINLRLARKMGRLNHFFFVNGCMARRLRFIPSGGAVVEVTMRTLQGRFLMLPTSEVSQLILGIIARAQARYDMVIHAFVFMSDHYHMLLSVKSAFQLARFMCYVSSNIAREVGKLFWKGRFWGRRYQAIVVSDEEAAQVARLKYILANGCKEGLVSRPQDWMGANVAWALLSGFWTIAGRWFDRTKEYRARGTGQTERFESFEAVQISPLPGWEHLSPSEIKRRAASLIQEIEAETAQMHRRQGTGPLGMEQVLRHHQHDVPKELETSPAPLFHAATKEIRQRLCAAYDMFLQNYRRASERLKAGEVDVRFPSGCFPPPRPFIESWAPG